MGLAFLAGIQDFYHRFGYITCMPEHEFSLATADARRAPSADLLIRDLREDDYPWLIEQYNAENETRTGSVLRQEGVWSGFEKGSGWGIKAIAKLLVDEQGRSVGYWVYDDEESACRVAELGGQGEMVYAAILHCLAERAERFDLERIHFALPGDHPFALYCRDYGLRQHNHYPRNQLNMGRVVDGYALVGSLAPELARRWEESQREQVLTLCLDGEAVNLAWNQDQLTVNKGEKGPVVRLRQQHFTQLIMGYVRPSDLRALGRLQGGEEIQALLERLFPLQEAQLWWSDRF